MTIHEYDVDFNPTLYFFFVHNKKLTHSSYFKEYINNMSAAAAVTQTLALTAVDPFLTKTATQSFFLSKTNKYAAFAADIEQVDSEEFTTNEFHFDVARHGDLLAGVILKVTGPGVALTDAIGNKTVVPGFVRHGTKTNIICEQSIKTLLIDDGEGGTEAFSPVHSANDLCSRYSNYAACHAIERVRFVASGQEIDSIGSRSIQIYHQCFAPQELQRCLCAGTKDERSRMSMFSTINWFVPIPFYFGTSVSRAWDLLATNFASLKVYIKLRDPTTLIENHRSSLNKHFTACAYVGDADSVVGVAADTDTTIANGVLSNALQTRKLGTGEVPAIGDYSIAMLCKYIYVSAAERKARLNEARDVVIIQHQEHLNLASFAAGSGTTTQTNKEISFNFPISAMQFLPEWSYRQANGELGDYTGLNRPLMIQGGNNQGLPHYLLDSIGFKFNNNRRQESQVAEYYTELTHERVPKYNHIYNYNFGINSPYADQPSGSANFSRIDSVKADLTCTVPGTGSVDVHVIATNYNVLSTSNGTAQLRFAS